jgi:hypothetical protein
MLLWRVWRVWLVHLVALRLTSGLSAGLKVILTLYYCRTSPY